MVSLLCFSTLATTVAQGPLPSISGPINYDPIDTSGYMLPIVKGGGSVRVTDAANGGNVPGGNVGSAPLGTDTNDLVAAPWNWEILLTNFTTNTIIVPIVISLPGGKKLVGTQKIDPPGGSSTGTEYFNLIIDEPTTGIFGGPDITQGSFYVTITPPKRGGFEPLWLGFDTSIVEEIGNTELRSTQFTWQPGLQFDLRDVLTITLNFESVAPNLSHPTGNLSLGLNGFLPSAASLNHAVPVAAGDDVTIELSSPSPQKFILVGDYSAVGGSTNLPWGGTLDLASPSIILNGIQPASPFDAMASSDFLMTLPTTCADRGSSWPALQAIYEEPTSPPFFLNHTEVGQVVLPTMIKTYYGDLPDDGFVQHDLCGTISYLGVNYSSLYLCSNGQITFGNGVTSFAPSAPDFFSGFQASGSNPNPGVAPIWTDLNRSNTHSDWISVEEGDGATGTRVAFMNQWHWSSGLYAGSWSCDLGLLGPNSVAFDLTGYIPGAPQNDDDPISGVTDGYMAPIGAGANSIVDFTAIMGAAGYTTPPGTEPESIMEQFSLAGADPSAPFDIGILNFTDATGTGLWTIF